MPVCAGGTSVLPDDGHYEAYTPLARVRTIVHPRRGAQQERAASPPALEPPLYFGPLF